MESNSGFVASMTFIHVSADDVIGPRGSLEMWPMGMVETNALENSKNFVSFGLIRVHMICSVPHILHATSHWEDFGHGALP